MFTCFSDGGRERETGMSEISVRWCTTITGIGMYVHVREMRRKEERSKLGQTDKAKQQNTPKAVTFPQEK